MHDLEANLMGGEPNAAVIVETAIASAEPKRLDGDGRLVGVVIPRGGQLEVVDVTQCLAVHQNAPARASGTYEVSTVDSFLALVGRHESSNLTIWVHPTSGEIQAVFNDHGRDQEADWGDHRAVLRLIKTEAWLRWEKFDGTLISQAPFAEHIQDGLTEIAEPAAADLLEIVQTMQGATSVSWKAGTQIVNGSVQMQYIENVDATAGRGGEMSVPQEFTLIMAPFIGEKEVQIKANLRWRLPSGKLEIGYKLVNPELVIREALERIADEIRAQFAGSVFIGTPRR